MVIGVKCTHSWKGKMWNVLSFGISSAGVFPDPAFNSGRGFSDLYARFVYFCLSDYSGWCVSLTHTPHIPHRFLVISRLFTLDLVLSFSQVSVVRGISPSLPSVFPSLPPLHSGMLFLFSAAKETHDFSTWCFLIHSDCQCVPLVTAVRRVQGAAGKLCPTGGCPFTDRETMEKTGRGEYHCHGPQRPRPTASSSSPSDPGVTSQPRLLHQEASSLLQMPR